MTDERSLDESLRAREGDAGCDAGRPILDAYVEIELVGGDPSKQFPGTTIHLTACLGCRPEHDGLIEPARLFADES